MGRRRKEESWAAKFALDGLGWRDLRDFNQNRHPDFMSPTWFRNFLVVDAILVLTFLGVVILTSHR